MPGVTDAEITKVVHEGGVAALVGMLGRVKDVDPRHQSKAMAVVLRSLHALARSDAAAVMAPLHLAPLQRVLCRVFTALTLEVAPLVEVLRTVSPLVEEPSDLAIELLVPACNLESMGKWGNEETGIRNCVPVEAGAIPLLVAILRDGLLHHKSAPPGCFRCSA